MTNGMLYLDVGPYQLDLCSPISPFGGIMRTNDIINSASKPMPKKVIFNNPATIVYWNDGTKTVVKCQAGDTFNEEVGLMAAMLKRYMRNDNTYNKIINELLSKKIIKKRERS